MSTPAQIAMIHTLKSKLRMDDDSYRAMLSGFGVESSKALSTSGAKAFIETLIGKVGGSAFYASKPPAYRSAEQFPRTATPAQQAKIRHLWDAVSRVPEQDRARALNNFLEKRFQISHISWLPRERVGKVIHTLETMVKQVEERV